MNRMIHDGMLALVLTIVLTAAGATSAQAQWSVVDAPAIVQLVHQVQTMEQELQTTRDQLLQAKQALQTMTGARGMERLLTGVPRNYLPTTWDQVTAAMQGGGVFSALAADIRAGVDANAVLTQGQLAALSPADQRWITALRQGRALQQALARESLSNASGRFASLQSLINAIPTAGDQKAILDLQARISVELGMLQNEQTKVQVLRGGAQAEAAIQQLQEREQVVAGHGLFAARFQPSP